MENKLTKTQISKELKVSRSSLYYIPKQPEKDEMFYTKKKQAFDKVEELEIEVNKMRKSFQGLIDMYNTIEYKLTKNPANKRDLMDKLEEIRFKMEPLFKKEKEMSAALENLHKFITDDEYNKMMSDLLGKNISKSGEVKIGETSKIRREAEEKASMEKEIPY